MTHPGGTSREVSSKLREPFLTVTNLGANAVIVTRRLIGVAWSIHSGDTRPHDDHDLSTRPLGDDLGDLRASPTKRLRHQNALRVVPHGNKNDYLLTGGEAQKATHRFVLRNIKHRIQQACRQALILKMENQGHDIQAPVYEALVPLC